MAKRNLPASSRQNSEPPIGIITTFSAAMIEANGGWNVFMRSFINCMADQNSWWLHRSRNKPQHDIAYVYISILGKLRYRVNYAGYETGTGTIYRKGLPHTVEWPRMLLTGPLVESPEEIPMQGFQGFRYVYEEPF